MTIRRFFFLMVSLAWLIIAARAQGQADSLVRWIPADWAGYVRLNTADRSATLEHINIAAFVSTVLQPTRADFSAALGWDDLFPLDALDVENASFSQFILPWLGDEAIAAYADLSPGFTASERQAVAIFATRDAFGAAAALSPAIRDQDRLRREAEGDAVLYIGDRAAIAITPEAVVIGAEARVRDVLATRAGEMDALTADERYERVSAALPADWPVRAIFAGESAGRAFSVLVGGGEQAAPLLAAVGETIGELYGVPTPEQALLRGDVDMLGVALRADIFLVSRMDAAAAFHVADAATPSGETDSAIFAFIPRSALLVQSGADAEQMAYGLFSSAPLTNFAARALGGFPVQESAALATRSMPTPTAEDMRAAVRGFADALEATIGIDVDDEIFERLRGSYALAVLPRPNDPLPGLNTPFEVLAAAQVVDGEEIIAALERGLAAFLGQRRLTTERIDGVEFLSIIVPETGEPLFRAGVVDDVLLVGTGSAVDTALAAYEGDNRLIDEQRWVALTWEDTPPGLYVDVRALYNTFLPSVGQRWDIVPVAQIGIHTRPAGEGTYRVRLLATLPNT